MDIIPQRNLPDPSQPWGRHIEKLATGNADDITKTNQRVTITNQNTASTISALQDQIAALTAQQNTLTAQQNLLASFVTYTDTESGLTWTTSDGGFVDAGASISFTLNRTATVLTTYSGTFFGATITNNNAQYQYTLNIDGSNLPFSYRASTFAASSAVQTAIPFNISNVSILASGTHTIKTQMQRSVSSASTQGNRLNGALLVVQIIN